MRGADKPLAGLCILAVDDEPDSREYLQRLLAEQGADIVSVGSAAEALEELRADTGRFNLLVSDIGMPGSTGYDLIEAVRKRLKVDARHLPAVALTAFTRREDSARALDKGFQKHLAKPVQVGRLIGAIRQLTGRQQTRRARARSAPGRGNLRLGLERQQQFQVLLITRHCLAQRAFQIRVTLARQSARGTAPACSRGTKSG